MTRGGEGLGMRLAYMHKKRGERQQEVTVMCVAAGTHGGATNNNSPFPSAYPWYPEQWACIIGAAF